VVVVVVVVVELTVVVVVAVVVSEAFTMFAVLGIVVVIDDCDKIVVSLVFATVARLRKIIRQELKHYHLI
jgi:hypothetical protein